MALQGAQGLDGCSSSSAPGPLMGRIRGSFRPADPALPLLSNRASARSTAPTLRRIVMNTDQLQGKWEQMKGEAKVQWGKLTDDDLDQVEGNAQKLAGRIQ